MVHWQTPFKFQTPCWTLGRAIKLNLQCVSTETLLPEMRAGRKAIKQKSSKLNACMWGNGWGEVWPESQVGKEQLKLHRGIGRISVNIFCGHWNPHSSLRFQTRGGRHKKRPASLWVTEGFKGGFWMHYIYKWKDQKRSCYSLFDAHNRLSCPMITIIYWRLNS